jgi:hypothetical protein
MHYKKTSHNLNFSSIYISLVVVVWLLGACSLTPQTSVSSLDEKMFLSPDSSYYTGVWWWWLRCPTTKEAITKDLEEMKAKKIQRFILSDFGTGGGQKRMPDYLEVASPEWNEMVRHTIVESKRLGLDFGICTAGSGCTAPWVTPEEAQQKPVFSEMKVEGPIAINTLLPHSNETGKGEDGIPIFYRDISLLAVPDKEVVSKEEIMDISTFMNDEGLLTWDVPAGKWKILRIGYAPTFQKMNEFVYLDHLRTELYDNYFKRYIGDILNSLTPEERSAAKIIESDSWEAGVCGWSLKFAADFQKLRGYDPAPYLPVLAGQMVDSKEVSDRFMADYRQTVSDLITNHYKYEQEVAHQNGLLTLAEASGPHQHWADALLCQKYSDLPMGEFWAPAKTHRTSLEGRFMAKEAVSAAHIYGKTVIPAESFTSIGPQWEEDPWRLKSSADRAFCEGVNQIYFHTYSHSPSLTAKPGYVYYAGSHFNRNITWWDYAYDWTTYLTRCQYMLQQGIPIADVCFYYGDGLKRKVYNQEVPILGTEYQYDYTNSDAIINRMTARNGKIYLPDGLSYEVLVLPEKKDISLEVLKKIKELVHDGATVTGPKPETSTGLYRYKETELKVKKIADELWGMENTNLVDKQYGKGRVVSGKSIRDVLSDKHILPDVEYKNLRDSSSIDFVHRTAGDADIYYLANLVEEADYANVSFRVTGKVPQIWDPADGSVVDQPVYADDGERISMPLYFDPFGSMFVVFREKKEQSHIVLSKSGERIFPQLPSQLPEKNYVHSEEIAAPWTVSFSKEWGGPEEIVFDRLASWTESEIPGIKYYSGTASYTNNFNVDENLLTDNIVYLDLGIMYNITEVIINGHNLGTCWKKPFKKDITKAIVSGDNTIELKVTNLWPNRLIGDLFLSEDKRFTETNILDMKSPYGGRNYFEKDDPLRPSGLLGPVQLQFYLTTHFITELSPLEGNIRTIYTPF